MKRITVFVSGGGTNCENLIRHFRESGTAQVALVISNRADAYALERARRLDVPVEVVSKAQLGDADYILPLLRQAGTDLVVLAGFLPMLPSVIIDAYPRRVINLHPSLLPKFGGKGMWGHHVHEAVYAARETETGITVHYVSPVCDGGDIIAQFRVPLAPTDTPDDIAAKVHELEMQHLPQVVERLISAI